MRSNEGGLAPQRRPLCGVSIPAVLLAAGLAAGCGHTQQYAYPGSAPSSYVGARAVAAATPVETVEVENDGMPVQAAPRAGIRQVPDDPREPWSRNYGGAASPPVRRADGAGSRPTANAAGSVGPGIVGPGSVVPGGVVNGYPVPVDYPPVGGAYRPVAWVQPR